MTTQTILRDDEYFCIWVQQFEKQLRTLYGEKLSYLSGHLTFLDFCIITFDGAPNLIDYSQN